MSIKKPSLECPKCKKQPIFGELDAVGETVTCPECKESIKNPWLLDFPCWQFWNRARRVRLFEAYRRKVFLDQYSRKVEAVDQNSNPHPQALWDAPQAFAMCRDVLVHMDLPQPDTDPKTTLEAKRAALLARAQYERLLSGLEITKLEKTVRFHSKLTPDDWLRILWGTASVTAMVLTSLSFYVDWRVQAAADETRAAVEEQIALAARVEAMIKHGSPATDKELTDDADGDDAKEGHPPRQDAKRQQNEHGNHQDAARSEPDAGSR